MNPGEGPRVLRTVYLPNEKVDSLLLTIESLRAQLQQQEQLGRERVAALHEDRRLRIEEERQRRAVEAEKLQEAESGVERMQSLVNKYTKDFLALKHDALQAQREEKETIEALRIDNRQARAAMDKGREAATLELQQHSSSAKASSEQYVALFRQQVTDTERTMGLLKDRHSGLQQALTMRVRELEEGSSRFKHKYRQLEERRRLEVEGFRSELDLLHRQLQGVEMRVFGKRTPLMELTDLESSQQGGGGAPSSFDGKTAVTRKALRAVSSRIAELAQAAP